MTMHSVREQTQGMKGTLDPPTRTDVNTELSDNFAVPLRCTCVHVRVFKVI